jgi:hypothetical protein
MTEGWNAFPQSQIMFIGDYEKEQLNKDYFVWVCCGINILKQLYLDILFAQELIQPTDWDPHTFIDAIKLIKYTMSTVMYRNGILNEAAELCLNFKDTNVPQYGTNGNAARIFNKWREAVLQACSELSTRVTQKKNQA